MFQAHQANKPRGIMKMATYFSTERNTQQTANSNVKITTRSFAVLISLPSFFLDIWKNAFYVSSGFDVLPGRSNSDDVIPTKTSSGIGFCFTCRSTLGEQFAAGGSCCSSCLCRSSGLSCSTVFILCFRCIHTTELLTTTHDKSNIFF